MGQSKTREKGLGTVSDKIAETRMDLDVARSKQRAAQQQAQKQPDGIARIGDRDTETGLYTVQTPDGGILANGIKTYTAASNPGDVVVMFPRADGSIALDSEKGSPTIVPDIFNKPVPEVKKAKFWILYFSAGRLWVGGHQAVPEDAGAVYFYGSGSASSTLEVDGGPGLILSLVGYRNSSNLHVWGDASGWVATYQTFPPDFDYTNETTFHSVTSTTHKKYSTSFGYGEDGGVRAYNADNIDSNTRSFPLGGGFVSYRSIRGISSIIPELIYGNVSQTASFVHQVSIGYLENTVPTVNQFSSIGSRSSIVFSYITTNETISYKGTIPIPHIDRPQANPVPYSGSYSCPEHSDSDLGPYSKNKVIVYPALSAQIVHNYPILCDRSSTFYVKESVTINSPSIQKIYELRSTGSPAVIATNIDEPRFFGIRWDTRESASMTGLWPDQPIDHYRYVTYSDAAYYYPDYYFDATAQGNSTLPIGHFLGTGNRYLPNTDYYNYPYFATFSGGQVVTVSSSEINKAKTGGGYLQRQSVDVSGTLSDLDPAFCYPIPADAIIYHWSTTV